MKTVAVIPIKGRLPLLKYTIRRLLKKNGCFAVICIGDAPEEKLLVESEGAIFVEHENSPLGKKWNAGFLKAKELNPDAVLFVGSSDWVCDDWLPYCAKFIQAGMDMVGKPDFYLLDIGDVLRFCHWHGYTTKERKDEPIGIGRVLSARILEQMNWQPIADELESSIDWSMYKRILALGGKVANIKTDQIKSLSISTNRWSNKHQFNAHYSNKLPSSRMPDFGNWLDLHFPEYKKIFND